ncbi:MAG: hypothetical protein Q3M30_03300 [Candidatus Electrothrix sp. Rat3]|nr:hypothetical protein [Candidatus Electrothrix rattekaaiensis]
MEKISNNYFKNRQDSLNKIQRNWLISVVVIAVLLIISSLYIVNSMTVFIEKDNLPSGWVQFATVIAINIFKIGILFPMCYIFYEFFLQYRSEREIEEQYAYKVAVIDLLSNSDEINFDKEERKELLSIVNTPIRLKK